MSPLYQTAADHDAQSYVGMRLAQMWGCAVIMLPTVCPADFLLSDPNGACFVEYKRRHNLRAAYQTLMIDKKKIDLGLRWSAVTGFSFGLAVQWNDGVYFMTVDKSAPRDIRPGSRRDRGDPNDIELVDHFSIFNFRKMFDA